MHLRKGDKDGSDGHPKCDFCNQRYYDKYELFVHLQKDHFNCHICKKREGMHPSHRYYKDYSSLESHFRNAHFLCEDRSCLEHKFVVFGDEFGLITHNKEYHPNSQTSYVRIMTSFLV